MNSQSRDHRQEFSLIRILHLANNHLDTEMVKELLHQSGLNCVITNVRCQAEFQECLGRHRWHVILADFALETFDGLSALKTAKQICPTTPFIFVTATEGEENAIESLKNGASDYVLKQNLVRLVTAIQRALQERALMMRRRHAERKRQKNERQFRFLAYHDTLTGLSNRGYLMERLSATLSDAERSGEKAALLFIDIDNFKVVNDSLGHSVGDLVLKTVAERLRSAGRRQDVVSRLAGDEFVLVLGNIKDSSDAGMAADRIQKLVSREMSADNHRLMNTCSIGIAVFPEDGKDAEALLKNADAALYAAKEAGRDTWRFFTADMNLKALHRLTLENALREALGRGQFYLEYQPAVKIGDSEIVGAEALLRWRHPDLGLVPTATFIQIAENLGEMVSIGKWVLKTACTEASAWNHIGKSPLTVAVNVSAAQCLHPSFLSTVREVLNETGLKPEQLEFEVSESQIAENAQTMIEVLAKLSEMGTGLAIDDFGAGNCSLSYLRHFQFSRLKIDPSFVRSVATDDREAALTEAIIHMAKKLGITVTAKCVETAEQMKRLGSIGCQEVQGYCVSQPVSPAVFAEKFLGR